MGTMNVSFHTAGGRSDEKTSMPVVRFSGMVTEIVTTSGTTAKTVSSAPAAQPSPSNPNDGGFATVGNPNATANLWVNAGPQATVTAVKPAAGVGGTGFPIAPGEKITFAIKPGDGIAAIEY